jgi:hypothetical protein
MFAELSTYLVSAAATTTTTTKINFMCSCLALFIWTKVVQSNTHVKWHKMLVLMITFFMIQQQQCMNMLSSRPFTSVLLLIIITKMFYDLFLARAIPSLQVPMNEAELSTDYDHFGKVTDPEMKLHDPKEPGLYSAMIQQLHKN